MDNFWLSFLPIFMAVNAIGLLPLFISLTEGLEQDHIRRIILQSVLTATAVSLFFLAVGRIVLRLLGITVADFMIAGGALLFIISLNDLLAVESKLRQIDITSMGAVPLGVPLIVGPAVLTTILILVPEHGIVSTVAALIANILIAGGMFWTSAPIIRVLGKSGAKTLSKIGDLLLAAIAVMMIRKGVEQILSGLSQSM
ncbi:MAG: MarC family protein [Syntrophales bacterium]|jgi:multiple antibiotic resistance protein|nr:MarC family protein [Syntrophales bacterium]MDD5533160.1 MarC family protein [Syntrophales bacterium]HPL62514.1 MarC family protein [Syntrophales bacterium]